MVAEVGVVVWSTFGAVSHRPGFVEHKVKPHRLKVRRLLVVADPVAPRLKAGELGAKAGILRSGSEGVRNEVVFDVAFDLNRESGEGRVTRFKEAMARPEGFDLHKGVAVGFKTLEENVWPDWSRPINAGQQDH